MGIPANLECDPGYSIVPTPGSTPPPPPVDDTKRETRYLSLREAIAIALENGTVGLQNPATPGSGSDSLGGFQGTAVASADAIRVLAFDPAITATNIETSLSKFDTFWNTSLMWNRTETPLGISPTVFTQTGSFLRNVAADNLTFNTSLEKPLPTGGVAGITFNLSSQWNTPSSPINPAVQPGIQFLFEQPLRCAMPMRCGGSLKSVLSRSGWRSKIWSRTASFTSSCGLNVSPLWPKFSRASASCETC
jgi:hypothetical protein